MSMGCVVMILAMGERHHGGDRGSGEDRAQTTQPAGLNGFTQKVRGAHL